jgi:VCBS repeat-containing protein
LNLDQVTIRATVETKANIAIDVKGKNDKQIEAGAKHDKKDEPCSR